MRRDECGHAPQQHDFTVLELPANIRASLAKRFYLEQHAAPAGLRGVVRPLDTVTRNGVAVYGRADMPDDFAYTVARLLDERKDVLQWSIMPFSYDANTVWKLGRGAAASGCGQDYTGNAGISRGDSTPHAAVFAGATRRRRLKESARSVCAGSTRAARRAGCQAAIAAAAMTSASPAANATPSSSDTARSRTSEPRIFSKRTRRRGRRWPAGEPRGLPHHHPTTAPAVAPSAIRIPISRERCVSV